MKLLWRNIPRIGLERLRKTIKNLSHNSPFNSQDPNCTYPKYKPPMLLLSNTPQLCKQKMRIFFF